MDFSVIIDKIFSKFKKFHTLESLVIAEIIVIGLFLYITKIFPKEILIYFKSELGLRSFYMWVFLWFDLRIEGWKVLH